MFANQERCVRRIRTPTHRAIEQFLVLKLRQKRRNSVLNTLFRRIRIRIAWMLCMRPRHRDALGCRGAVRLVHLVAREARELVADFYDAVLVRLKEEADGGVVDYRHVLV